MPRSVRTLSVSNQANNFSRPTHFPGGIFSRVKLDKGRYYLIEKALTCEYSCFRLYDIVIKALILEWEAPQLQKSKQLQSLGQDQHNSRCFL